MDCGFKFGVGVVEERLSDRVFFVRVEGPSRPVVLAAGGFVLQTSQVQLVQVQHKARPLPTNYQVLWIVCSPKSSLT